MSPNVIRRIVPLLDRVIIRKLKPLTKTLSGIYLPENLRNPTQCGEVISVGVWKRDVYPKLFVGDNVILPSYGGFPVNVNDETLYIYNIKDILAKISK